MTHRAIAREADTSLRATTYYFDSREALLVEALRHYARTALERFEALALPVDAVAGAEAPLDLCAALLAEAVMSDVEGDRDGLLAEVELVLESARTGSVTADYLAWERSLLAILERYSTALGSADPALDARVILATLRGLELEALASGRPPDRAALVRVFRRLLDAFAE